MIKQEFVTKLHGVFIFAIMKIEIALSQQYFEVCISN